MHARTRRYLIVLGVAAGVTAAGLASCNAVKRQLVAAMTPDYTPEATAADGGTPVATSAGVVVVDLKEVAAGFSNITDLQFVPGKPGTLLVLEKNGALKWLSLPDGARGTLLTLEVLTVSEMGLLGLAYHPGFERNGRVYLNFTIKEGRSDVSVVEEWRFPAPFDVRTRPERVKRVMTVEQPYPNHNAGQLQFGPDGYLYVGWGDGGLANDPHGHGQDATTMLGSMLRIDVDREEGGKPYGIPADNPFLGRPDHLPETWAIGLRNPWRYSFDPQGRLIVADVGQNKWEEITLLEKGSNAGWNIREGAHCFKPATGCRTEGLQDPIFEYGRELGQSVTGGYVYLGSKLPHLHGRYIFGDFLTGRIWALELPERNTQARADVLGKWPILISTFGRDLDGELYAADFGSGKIFRLSPR